MDDDFDEPEPDFELTDSQENAYDEDLGTLGRNPFRSLVPCRVPRRDPREGARHPRTSPAA